MKKLAAFLFCLPHILLAQMHDNTWLFGNKNDTILDNDRGIQILTFPDGKVQIEQNTQLMRFNFWETNTSFSDSSGNVLSYTNGVHIGNSAWEIMENGEHITDALEAGGELWCQWMVSLPWPGKEKEHIYLYEEEGWFSTTSFHAKKLFFLLDDMSANNGLGTVLFKDSLIVEDTLVPGKINAVKHANGRDWWILVNEENSNRYYRILLDPQGIHVVGNQTIGTTVYDGVGQSVFSPNGEHYAVFNTVSSTLGAYIDLYDFDRCEGLLSNHRQSRFFSNDWGGEGLSPPTQGICT